MNLFRNLMGRTDGKQPHSEKPQIFEEPQCLIETGQDGKQPIFEEPQCLIKTGQDGGLHVNEAVIEQLQQLDGQLVVVAITGIYRTGKSYLMNRLAGKNAVLALGSVTHSKTKGILIWVRRHPRRSDTYLVLLDTEGLGDPEQEDANYDNWIFTLSVLLSSTFVYNYLGVINDDMITKMSFVSEISKMIKIRESDREGEDAEFERHFPVFILALRDFYLELKIKGKKVTADQYLEHLLNMEKGRSPEFIESRRCIRKYFKTRKCFTFDRPATRRQLKDLETLKDHELNKDFLDDSKAFTDYVFNECPIMKLPNGTKLTGLMFASLVGTYVTSIREGDLPCVQNAFTMMAEQVNRKAIEGAILHYRELVEARVDLPTETEQELTDINSQCQKEAMGYFTSKVIMDIEGKFQKTLSEKLMSVYASYVEKNRRLSREKCQKVLNDLDIPIKKKIQEGFYTVAGGLSKFKQDLEDLKHDYKQHTGLGVEKDKMLDDYINATAKTSAIIAAAEEKMTEQDKEMEEIKQAEFRRESERKNNEEVMKQMRQLYEGRKEAQQETMNQMKDKHEEDIRQLRQFYEGKITVLEETINQMKEKQEEEMKQQSEIHEKRMREQERILTERFKKEAEKIRTEEENSKAQIQDELQNQQAISEMAVKLKSVFQNNHAYLQGPSGLAYNDTVRSYIIQKSLLTEDVRKKLMKQNWSDCDKLTLILDEMPRRPDEEWVLLAKILIKTEQGHQLKNIGLDIEEIKKIDEDECITCVRMSKELD